MAPQLAKWLEAFLEKEKLPVTFRDIATGYYVPLAEQIQVWIADSNEPLILGINGGQGTGKSTLSEFISQYLTQEYGLETCIISIDDLYLDKGQRDNLASMVHPLLATRGVPGTHDVRFGIQLLTELKSGVLPKIPRFNKATDQPFSEDTWLAPEKAPQLIILEGWCVGARSQKIGDLDAPINSLEANEDPDGKWRKFVNTQLAENYAPFYNLLDRVIMLKTPSFEMIHQWRSEQEVKLATRVAETGGSAEGIMSPDEITRFISHYERLTRWMIEEMPQRADITFQLNADHAIDSVDSVTPFPSS